jgi:hypothetical protein
VGEVAKLGPCDYFRLQSFHMLVMYCQLQSLCVVVAVGGERGKGGGGGGVRGKGGGGGGVVGGERGKDGWGVGSGREAAVAFAII